MAGCAEGRDPINQVQPGALHRSVLEDSEWYYQQTVIDSPYSAGYTFVGEQGELERIRWEVQEEFLVARRAYEYIAGSETNGISGDATETGAPVAMYRIESHFDIRRAYNPVTGEELNILTENSTDRPWYQRDYIRVDWSENLITDNSFLVLARVFDGIETEPAAYYVEDPSHPHAPRFEARQADGTWENVLTRTWVDGEQPVQYIDIVNKMFVRPTTVEIEGLGPVPSCYMLYQGHLDCAPGEVTVRNSFLRVDHEDRDYEPQLYTGDRMERFGYFVTERAGYDAHYGVVEPARFRFANRHNLWQQSHRRNADGTLVGCSADDQCGGGGSVCDLDLARAMRSIDTATGSLRGACTIPYRERQVRPIAYYLSSNFPADLVPDAQHLSDEWNRAFRDTVASLREVECRENGGDSGACAGERMREDHQQMFVLCHNPVADTDHAACGAPGTSPRPGDLRYSMIGWVSDAHLSSPLGYGPSSADPLTGEIIMGNAFIYGAAMETLTTFARDIIAVINGDLDESDVTAGAQVQAWIERQEAPGSELTGRTAHDHVIEIDGLDAHDINEAMDFSWAQSGRPASRAPSSPAEFIEAMENAERRLHQQGAFGDGVDRGDAALGRLVGTDIERMMTTDEVRMAGGIDPELPVTEGLLEQVSPLRGGSLANQRALARARERMQHDHCVVGAEFADEGLLGLAREIVRAADENRPMVWYGEEYQLRGEDGELNYNLVRAMLRHPIFDAVTAHEVGHTIGLRHNFSGSYDALNYLPRYWELRDDGTMEPRAWDPLTSQERDGRILEYQYSTVMDYGVNFVVTDPHGISHYDSAAVKMGYGDLVEVFSNAATPGEVAWVAFIQSAGWPVPLRFESFTGGEPSAFVYTDWPEIVGGVERLQQREDVRYTSLRPDSSLAFQGIRDPLVDPDGRPIVPYMFCSDEQADLNPDCQRYDQGADAYESVQSVIDNYWNYYIFNSFRRGRLGFSPESLASRVHGRYFEKLQRANQIYALYRGVFQDIFGGSAGYDAFWTRPDGMGSWTLAVGAGFQLLTRVVTTPEPGEYTQATRGDGSTALLPAAFGDTVALEVDPFDGRAIETTWDFNAGYYWFDQLDRVGYFYDKIIALQVLVDPTTYFLGRDTDADIRQYQINFGSSFGPSLTAFMEGVLAEDWTVVAPRDVSGELRYPTPLEMQNGTMPSTPVDPNASFSIQLYSAVYGMAYIPQTYDQTFLNRSRIFVRGGAEEVEIDPTLPVIEFLDPESGLTYVAVSYPVDADGVPGGATRETGVGAAMLLRAQALSDAGAGSAAELRRYIDNIDLIRRLTWQLGFGAQP
ncbi:zinc-dependent metalloprotease [Sandaracinus amylolyticus]|uniref:zinc-dependent metalloprotease n=1 Tax=Sandaracinus amylolyticus TaxID=927083 RepID=UPI00069E924F|nr:zinc-dependent metalloprotease [Sandaracinus amylolyticus]